jgi:uncharacterized membrane protein YfcA
LAMGASCTVRRLAAGYVGALIQHRLPHALIRGLVGVLVVAIGAQHLWSGLS